MSNNKNDLVELYKVIDTVRTQIDQAKGRKTVVESQIANEIEKLKELGVSPENAQEVINALTEEVNSLYEKATNLKNEISSILNKKEER